MMLVSCGEAQVVRPERLYQSAFDVSKIEVVRRVVKELADKRKLKILESNPVESSFVSNEGKGLVMFFMYKGDGIITVANLGKRNLLTIAAYDLNKYPVDLLVKVAEILKTKLETEVDLKFCDKDPVTSLCGSS